MTMIMTMTVVARLVQSGHATRGPGSLGRAVECTESSHSESCWQPPAASWRGNGELFICSPKNEQEVFIGSRTTSKFGSNQLKLCSIYNLFLKNLNFVAVLCWSSDWIFNKIPFSTFCPQVPERFICTEK